MRGALCQQDLDEGVRDAAAQTIRSAFSPVFFFFEGIKKNQKKRHRF
jgi:hypothetical protein